MQAASDAELVARARDGNLEAFETLISRHERRAFNLAYRMLGHREDAADVLQEALIKVYQHLGEFRGDAAFSSWLHRVIVNSCMGFRRRAGRRAVRHAPSLDAAVGNPYPLSAPGEGPEATVLRRETQDLVQRALAQLPPEQRALVLLRDIEGYSYQELTAALGCGVGTAKSKVFRARQALARVLRSMGVGAPALNAAR